MLTMDTSRSERRDGILRLANRHVGHNVPRALSFFSKSSGAIASCGILRFLSMP
jgi:hypothetical protein